MASKTFMAVLLAIFLLVSSEVAAGEVAEQQEKKVNDANVADQKYIFGTCCELIKCRYRCCQSRNLPGRCRCCGTADEMSDAEYVPELRN